MLNCTKQSVKNTAHVEYDAVCSCKYVRTFRKSTLRTALLWVIAQRVVIILHRRFGTTCGSHLYGTERSSRNVGNYHYSLRNIPEERDSHLLRGGSLKSCSVLSLYSMQKTNCSNLPDYTASHTSSLALRNVYLTYSATDCCRLPITTVGMALAVDNAPLNYYLFCYSP